MKKRRLLSTITLALALALSLVISPFAATVAQAAPAPSKAALSSSVKVDKKATLNILPADYGKKMMVIATFSTGYKNRVVSLQYKDGKKWKQAASAKMDSKGNVTFSVTSIKKDKTYRAVADTHKVKTTKKKKTTTKTIKPVTTPSVKAGSQWKRVVRDSFSGTKLNKRWGYKSVGQFWGSRLCSAVDAKQTKVKDGKLVQSIRQLDKKDAAEKKIISQVVKNAKVEQQARKDAATKAAKKLKGSAKTKALKDAKAMKVDGCPNGVFYNARVETKDSVLMSEGMVAARVKFPKDQGMHGSVWLQTIRNNSVDRPAGTEIDMIESFGYGKGVSNIIHNDVLGDGTLTQFGHYVIKDKTKDPKWWDKYHVYSVEWTRSEFIFRIDGVETERFKKKAVKGDKYYLAISMLASDWETKYLKKPSGKLPGLKKANLPKAKMYVDWIEGWERA